MGDPSSKIVELAEKLDVDLIMMGRTGIGNSNDDIGHVVRKVLKITSKPVCLVQMRGFQIHLLTGEVNPPFSSHPHF